MTTTLIKKKLLKFFKYYIKKLQDFVKKQAIAINKYKSALTPKFLKYKLKYKKFLRKTTPFRKKLDIETQKPYFYPLIILSGWILFLGNNLQINHQFYKREFREQFVANQYPKSISKQISLIHRLYEKGYPKLSKKFLEKLQQNATHKLWLSNNQKKQIELISTFVFLPQKEKIKRQKLAEQLLKTPYSWPLRLEKARLDLEFGKSVSAQKNIKVALWLKPDIKIDDFREYLPSLK